jgi:hypothetical protein
MRLVIMAFCCVACSGVCGFVQSDDVGSAETVQVQLRQSACQCRKCFIAESPNFRVHCCSTAERITELVVSCEQQRTHCQQVWVGEPCPTWHSKCELVVHRDVRSYSSELGRGSERTSGCSTIQLDRGRVVRRRIDLRADAIDCYSDSLPHELTHVVLADQFPESRIPPWADEGIAMLPESPEKLQRRLTVLHGYEENNKFTASNDNDAEPCARVA